MKKKTTAILSICALILSILFFINWFNKIGEYQLQLKALLWQIYPNERHFKFSNIQGILPSDYFILNDTKWKLTIIKLKPKRNRNPWDNFEGPNLKFNTTGIEFSFQPDLIDNIGKKRYYGKLNEAVRFGTIPEIIKDTLFLNGQVFEGRKSEYINFKTGNMIYIWGLSKEDIINKFQMQCITYR